ncbi:MAG: hypothetical protein FJ090_18300 [Deltaproteobacteria bacterium]|nr:hypothetical protein [Deltaproteobacteria bacterium]
MKLRLLSSVAVVGFFALACTGGETTTTTTTTTEAPPAPTAPTAPTTPAATTTTTGDVGVASCDQYIKEMTACLANMDAATKAALEASFKQTADAWRAAAATPEGKAGLEATCQAALGAMPPNCKADGTAPAADAAKTDDKDEHDANPRKQGKWIGHDDDGKRKEGKKEGKKDR